MVIITLIGGSFYCYKNERTYLNLKFDYIRKSVTAKRNPNDTFIFLKNNHPFIKTLWMTLQNKIKASQQKVTQAINEKNTSIINFRIDFKNWRAWVNENKWPTLTKTATVLSESIENINIDNFNSLKQELTNQSKFMKEVVIKSGLAPNTKKIINSKIIKLQNTYNNIYNIKPPKTIDPNKYDHFKNIFKDIYVDNINMFIGIKHQQIGLFNLYKKYFFYTIIFFSIILLIKFIYTIKIYNKQKSITLSKLNTSQLIIELLCELQEVGELLCMNNKFSITSKNSYAVSQITFTIGGVELNKHALHFQHVLKNGRKKSLFNIFFDLKDRKIKFNCSNYYKENNTPHSFTITLSVPIST